MLNRILPLSVIRSLPSAPLAVPIERIPKYEPPWSPEESNLAVRSYRCGSSGDHRWACGTGSVRSVSAAPVTEPTPGTETRTADPVPETVLTLIFNEVVEGVSVRDEMCAAGTGSIHTVRQMPELP